MSAIKELIGKGIAGAKDDELDGPKPASVTAGFLKRMWKHMEEGDFNSAAECFNRAVSVAPGDDEEEEKEEEEEGEGAYR
jgi:hypothetical protein